MTIGFVGARALVAGLVAMLASCGSTHSPAPSASSSVAPSAAAADPCAEAATQRARVAELREGGRLDRALRVLDRARTLCPADAEKVMAEETAVRAELEQGATDARLPDTDEAKAPMRAAYRDAAAMEDAGDVAGAKARYLEAWALWHPNGQALVQAGLAAAKLGERAEAQRLFDRGLAEVERATGKKVVLDTPNGWGQIEDVAWSSRGRIAVAHDKVVSILAQGTLSEVARLEGHEREILWIAFSPDGALLVSHALDGTHRVWDVAKGSELGRLPGPVDLANGAFSPTGDRFVAGTNRAIVWDPRSMEVISTLDAKGVFMASQFLFGRDGLSILASSTTGGVRRWALPTADAPSGSARELPPIPANERTTHLALSPDGKSIATASGTLTITLRDLATGRETRSFKGHTDDIASLRFSPDGRVLASGSWTEVHLWEVATGRDLLTLRADASAPLRIAFSPDGKLLVTGSRDHTLRFWDVSTGRELMRREEHTAPVGVVAFAPDRGVLAQGAIAQDGTLLWSLRASSSESGTDAAGVPALRRLGAARSARTLAFTPDGKHLATVDVARVDLTEVDSGRVVRSFTESDGVEAIAVSPDGATLVTSAQGQFQTWDVASGDRRATLEGDDPAMSLAFSPDGRWLLATGKAAIRAWDMSTGLRAQPLVPPTNLATVTAAWSPDGKLVASGGWDPVVHLTDPIGRRAVAELRGHTDAVEAIAFSRDGKRLVTGSIDRTVRVWDVDSATEIRRLDAHAGRVWTVAFSDDGDLLATGSVEGSIILWRGRDLERIATLRALRGGTAGYVFTPDSFIELVGAASEAAADYPLCRVGAVAFPFAVCRERFEVRSLLTKVIAGDTSHRLP